MKYRYLATLCLVFGAVTFVNGMNKEERPVTIAPLDLKLHVINLRYAHRAYKETDPQKTEELKMNWKIARFFRNMSPDEFFKKLKEQVEKDKVAESKD